MRASSACLLAASVAVFLPTLASAGGNPNQGGTGGQGSNQQSGPAGQGSRQQGGGPGRGGGGGGWSGGAGQNSDQPGGDQDRSNGDGSGWFARDSWFVDPARSAPNDQSISHDGNGPKNARNEPAAPSDGALGPQPVPGPGPSTKPEPEAAAARPTADPAPALTPEDIAANFATVVQTYVASRSDGGLWTFREAGGRAAKLALVSIDGSTPRALGKQRYAGAATLRDARGKTVRLEFVVDLSGAKWSVQAVRRLGAARERPGRKTAPR